MFRNFCLLRTYLLILNSILTFGFLTSCSKKESPGMRWSAEKAQLWYAEQPWLIGCNYIPSTAINQLEMWQAETFDPQTIDRELGWAQNIGFNVVRVYLHDLAFNEDPKGFLNRVDTFLGIAKKHQIRVLFVIFDDCWLDNPKAGLQPEPWTGVHNSGWLQSPGLPQLKRYPEDTKLQNRLKNYVTQVLRRFKDDNRVLMWDLYNEPGGWWYRRGNTPGEFDKELTGVLCLPLLTDVYQWAREVNPTQPLTTCWNRGDYEEVFAFQQADILTFHHYGDTQGVQELIDRIKKESPGRPLICTEYLSRSYGSNFKSHLPLFKSQDIGAINWGLVFGKTNTIWPWSSWENPNSEEPELWHHDIFRPNGVPYDSTEVSFIRTMVQRSK